MAKPNTLAEEVTAIALQQLQTSYLFRSTRIRDIRKYRRLYNAQVEKKLRVQFNVPLPVFAGMVDTLQADLDDILLLKFKVADPADWKAAMKAQAAMDQTSNSTKPGGDWSEKIRDARQEVIFSGRGILGYTASDEGGFTFDVQSVAYEDFFWEPGGGGNLEEHLFCGQQNIWKTKTQLEEGAGTIYDREQVKKLTGMNGESVHKNMASIWGEWDEGARFAPLLDQTPESYNYVGENVYHFIQWAPMYKGIRWYLLFEAFTGTWIRFEKMTEVCSANYIPWMSFASHKDKKNWASKSFADDLYPVADSIITLFNQELTNRQKRNLHARAYDKEMFKDVSRLDEAQHRPDALVPVDTKGGTRTIASGIYSFETAELKGTVDLISWLKTATGQDLGVTDLQRGAPQPATKKVGVVFAELAQINKRLSFMSQPFIKVGQELGLRFFSALKDYLKEPMSIELLGETGIEWDVLRRVDLDVNKDFEIDVSSQAQVNKLNEIEKVSREKALDLTAESTNINPKVRDEFILRDLGKFSEADIAVLMDTQNETNKETWSEVSAAIQEIVIRGKKPGLNYNADLFFLKRVMDFAKRHRDTLSDRKYNLLIEFAEEHVDIAKGNVENQAVEQARLETETAMAAAIETPPGEEPATPTPGAPALPGTPALPATR